MLRLFACLLLLGSLSVRAESPVIAEARQALADGLPTVAIYRLQSSDRQIPAAERSAADLLLARALIAAGQYEKGVALLEKQPSLDADSQMDMARACVALGRNEQALSLLEKLQTSPALSREAGLQASVLLQALGRVDESEAILVRLLEKNGSDTEVLLALAESRLINGQPQKTLDLLDHAKIPSASEATASFFRARALAQLGRAEESEQVLEGIQDPPPALTGEITIARVENEIAKKDLSNAEKILEQFIDENPRLPALEPLFVELDRVYSLQGAASGAELRRWSEDDRNENRAMLALLYLAYNEERNSKVDRSRELYRSFLDKYPGFPLVDQARIGIANSFLTADNMPMVLKALEGAPANGEAGFLRGLAQASSGKYQQAVTSFMAAAETPRLREGALFNAAVCISLSGLPEEDNVAIRQIKEGGFSPALLERIRLTQALFLAGQRRPEAKTLLLQLANGGSEVSSQARLALAEWDYLQLDLAGAEREIRQISSGDPAERERAAYLDVFLADTGEESANEKVIARAEDFLKAYPRSAFVPDVRMKLGEIYFRRGDYLGARGQFSTVAEDFPASPLAANAAFLAAQSMARSMDPQAMEEAIELYEDVAKGGGALAVRARLSQATLYNAMKRPKEALAVLDNVIASGNLPEVKFIALLEKGDTLFSLGEEDKENYRKAIATWQVITTDPAADNRWSNQALSKMGAAYEKLGETNDALNCYYSVISKKQGQEPEYFWYYRCGFDAGRLLEQQKLWTEAIAVYEKIAALEGPRADEARSRVNSIRLENFLW